MSGMARFTKNMLSVNHYFIIYEGYWLKTLKAFYQLQHLLVKIYCINIH